MPNTVVKKAGNRTMASQCLLDTVNADCNFFTSRSSPHLESDAESTYTAAQPRNSDGRLMVSPSNSQSAICLSRQMFR